MKIVTRYVLKEFLFTFFITFLFFFVIFFINHILVNIKPLLKKNIPLDLVIMMMITFFPMIIIFSLPFGTMLATLMVMGRFSTDNEIIAFRALGFSYLKIFGPIFICGIIITIATFLVNDRLVPYSYHQQIIIIRKINQIKPTLNFKSKTVKKYESPSMKKHEVKTIFTDIVEENKIKGLFIMDKDSNNQKRIIIAKEAEIISSDDRKGVLELKMTDTMIQLENKDRPQELNFGYSDELSYYINLQEYENIDPKERPPVFKNITELFKDHKQHYKTDLLNKFRKKRSYISMMESTKSLIYSNEKYMNDISINSFKNNIEKIDKNMEKLNITKQKNKKEKNAVLNDILIEIYRKFTNPLACIIFAIFAAPIGIYSRRAGFQIGFILGLFLTAFYWFAFSGTFLMGRRFILQPFIAMSLPNLIFLVIGVYFLFKRLKE